MVFLKYKKLDKTLPDLKYAYETDCCFDFVSAIDTLIFPMSHSNTSPIVIPTGMVFDIPVGYELQIRSRSGLASKGIIVTNSPGTVDCSYTGEAKIIMSNLGSDIFKVLKGDRIAQGKISIKPHVTLKEVDEIESFGRGENGFGSSGVK